MNKIRHCDACSMVYPVVMLCVCGDCGGHFCPGCWDLHDCETKCLYCGMIPCRCDEIDAVKYGLARQGVKITDETRRSRRSQRKGVLNG